jgi:hypothetical protein
MTVRVSLMVFQSLASDGAAIKRLFECLEVFHPSHCTSLFWTGFKCSSKIFIFSVV